MPAPGWPVRLGSGPVGIRPLRLRDATAWSAARIRNERWLAPWEGGPPGAAAAPWSERHTPAAFAGMLRVLHRESRAGRCLPFAVVVDGRLAGQLTVGNVVRGAFLNANIGYWLDEAVAGRGVMPTAVALAVDHCFGPVGLHRIEANIRPANRASCRVVEKLGFRREGEHARMLFIDGQWRDHVSYAVTIEDVPGSMLARYLAG